MPTPANKELYERIKKEVYEEMPKHSAYRSSILVKRYKEAGGKYLGKKTNSGLVRWHKESWKNQRGEEGYGAKGDIYRPTKRVNFSVAGELKTNFSGLREDVPQPRSGRGRRGDACTNHQHRR